MENIKIKDRFSEETPSAIQKRLQKDFSKDVDTRQGSLVGDLTRGNADEFSYAYKLLDFILKTSVLGLNMPSDILTIKAQEYGITRYPANGSKGIVTFTGDEGTVIPKGTVVRNSIGEIVRFQTNADVKIPEGKNSVDVGVESIEKGLKSNVRAGAIDTVVGDLSGVLDVSNKAQTEGGYNEQTDEELLERIYNRINRPITSGNVYHYEKWATDIDGIRKAKVYPLWDGNGTVKVVLLSTSGTAPTEEKRKEVAEYIEENRPIGATVTVTGAKEVPIDVEATLTIRDGYSVDEVTQEYTEMLTLIFSDTAFKTDVVRYSRLAALALDTEGVVDWEGMTINGKDHNIVLNDDEIAVVGEVTFYAK